MCDAGRHTDGRTAMTKLTVVYINLTVAPKKYALNANGTRNALPRASHNLFQQTEPPKSYKTYRGTPHLSTVSKTKLNTSICSSMMYIHHQ
jgi:hypothetical protein